MLHMPLSQSKFVEFSYLLVLVSNIKKNSFEKFYYFDVDEYIIKLNNPPIK